MKSGRREKNKDPSQQEKRACATMTQLGVEKRAKGKTMSATHTVHRTCHKHIMYYKKMKINSNQQPSSRALLRGTNNTC